MKQIKKKPFSQSYRSVLQKHFHPYHYLSDEEIARLEIKTLYFLEYIEFAAIDDLEVTQEMKLLVAAQASLLIMNLDVKIYPDVDTVYLINEPFIEKDNPVNPETGLPMYVPRLGESWKGGDVVLAWHSVQEGLEPWHAGHNVTLHEFAHQLDGEDGVMDGTPVLSSYKDYGEWQKIMLREYEDLKCRKMRHLKSSIDKYGATNDAEFFAVTVEEFFLRPKVLKKKHPSLYKLFAGFFKIEPTKWDVF